MLLDLSEIFVCPDCRPTQGLVVLVDEIEDRRVVRGHLGCPSCEARFPVDRGTLRFDVAGTRADEAEGPPDVRGARADAPRQPTAGAGGRGGGEPAPPRAGLFRGASADEAALRLAALLGLPGAEGPFLLFPGLAVLAVPLAEAAEGGEVLALTEGDGSAGAAGRRVTRVVGAEIVDLPVFSGRLGGAAILEAPPEAVEEAVRTLREGARIVVVEPSAEARDCVAALPVEVVAEEPRALVAVRRA